MAGFKASVARMGAFDWIWSPYSSYACFSGSRISSPFMGDVSVSKCGPTTALSSRFLDFEAAIRAMAFR